MMNLNFAVDFKSRVFRRPFCTGASTVREGSKMACRHPFGGEGGRRPPKAARTAGGSVGARSDTPGAMRQALSALALRQDSSSGMMMSTFLHHLNARKSGAAAQVGSLRKPIGFIGRYSKNALR